MRKWKIGARILTVLALLLPLVAAACVTTASQSDSEDPTPDPSNAPTPDPDENSDDDDNDDNDDADAAPDLAVGRVWDDTAFVDDILENMERYHFPGMALAIVQGERLLWSRGLGLADIEKQIPMTIDTLFAVGSLSKIGILLATMKLWQEGMFDLTDNVGDYLPFTVTHPDWPDASIEIGALLSHTSSIRDRDDLLDEWVVEGDHPISLDDFLSGYLTPGGAYFDSEQNYWPAAPGTDWNYSNVAASLAGQLIAELGGESFESYVTREIFAPLDVEHAGYRLADLNPDEVATPYSWSPLARAYRAEPHLGYVFYPAATLRIGVRELARLMMTLINNGTYQGLEILEPETVWQIRQPLYPEIEPLQGIVLYYLKYDEQQAFGHQGGGQGTVAKFFYRPDSGLGVILLANRDWGTLAERAYIERLMIDLFRLGETLSAAAEK